jgi:hypothetical protein
MLHCINVWIHYRENIQYTVYLGILISIIQSPRRKRMMNAREFLSGRKIRLFKVLCSRFIKALSPGSKYYRGKLKCSVGCWQ